MTVLPGLIAGASLGALLTALLIVVLEIRFAYWRPDEPRLRRWFAKRTREANSRIRIVWSPDALPKMEDVMDLLIEQSKKVPVDIVFGPADSGAKELERNLTARVHPSSLKIKILDVIPDQDFAVLVSCDPVRLDEFGLDIFQRLIVQAKLPLQDTIGHAPFAL